ncbi:ferredoxin [Streptomyces sp. NPDC051985]|uniref:ferredoxin n=1 Tax=Streptomyces sp. NPDC051985 TaxID=3155807 RepID=UPI0034363DFA
MRPTEEPLPGAARSPARVGILVDRDTCVGSGACALFEPEFFDQSEEDGLVLPRVREAAPEALPALRAAASRCPARAISLSLVSLDGHDGQDGYDGQDGQTSGARDRTD